MDLNDLMLSFKDCPCGRRHVCELKSYAVYPGASRDIGALLKKAGFAGSLHLVADSNTVKASGDLPGALSESGFTVHTTVFENLGAADVGHAERVAGEGKDADAFLAVGTGSVNDITKYASFLLQKPYAVFATAPSMDGFASTVAALLDNGLKKSIPAHSPSAVFADSRILAAAPARLKSSGYADIIGKYTALVDWEAAHLLTGEYYCEKTAELMRRAVRTCVGITGSVPSDDVKTAEVLMEALVLAGIGMQLCGNSRPAAGAEHLIAHFWEMRCLQEGRNIELHGKKVGIATVLAAGSYHALARRTAIETIRKPSEDAEIRAAFGVSGEEIIRLNTPSLLEEIRREEFVRGWGKIRAMIAGIPQAEEIAGLLREAGAWTLPEEAGEDEQNTALAMRFGCYVHRKLTLMQAAKIIR